MRLLDAEFIRLGRQLSETGLSNWPLKDPDRTGPGDASKNMIAICCSPGLYGSLCGYEGTRLICSHTPRVRRHPRHHRLYYTYLHRPLHQVDILPTPLETAHPPLLC